MYILYLRYLYCSYNMLFVVPINNTAHVWLFRNYRAFITSHNSRPLPRQTLRMHTITSHNPRQTLHHATTQDTCTPSVAYSTSPKKEDITLKENTVSSKPKEDATLAKNITLSEPNPISFLPPSEGIRAYQRELAQPGLDGENYIICAPTGSGKTLIAAMIISEHLKKGQEIGEERKVLFLVKTQQLAHQQKDQLKRYVSKARIALVIGEEQLYIAPILPIVDLVVCTAGKICNELKSKDVSITDFSLLVVDECHHTHGTDPYSEILEFYLMAKLHGSITKVPQVVGLTALPGAGRGQTSL